MALYSQFESEERTFNGAHATMENVDSCDVMDGIGFEVVGVVGVKA